MNSLKQGRIFETFAHDTEPACLPNTTMTPPKEKPSQEAGPPLQLLHQAEAAAAGNAETEEHAPRPPRATGKQDSHEHIAGQGAGLEQLPDIDVVPPPAYNSKDYGQLAFSQMGLDTGANVARDGRVNININQRNRTLTNLLAPALRNQLDIHKQRPQPEPSIVIPPGLGADVGELPPPPMNIVIQIVGSRGDVQPFIALGKVLNKTFGHRVRVATHPTFRDFVTENGLEFFSIGGDPAELMAFMVKNPGLMPGFDAMRNGDIGKRRKGIHEMVTGCWRSCIEVGDGTGVEASDSLLDGRSFDSGVSISGDPISKPFVADAIIANPPSFAHVHIAEKLGIPLHIMFTMPWSPTQAFPHPLANVISTNCDLPMTNFITYALIDMMTWQGLGDVINRFRQKTLNLEPVSIMWAPGMASRLRIPHTYCWSPALIPKPGDWGNHIDISGFYFLNLASDYTPPPDLAAFLADGPPPVYIGFGSIVVDDPNAMTKLIFEAVKKTGQRALVSKGWGGIGADQLGIPDGVFMLGNCPHDWLFKQVSCVVHHGGAGTSAAGISSGRPTVVVPFFGDQPFWGAMIARAGAGPKPIPYKDLTADQLAAAIEEALKPESLERAAELSDKIKQEKGSEDGAKSFHKQLQVDSLRCVLYPKLPAAWRVKRTDIRISALAATVLGNEGLLDFGDLKLYRSREYDTDEGPWEPFTGAAAALIGTIGNMMMGVADFPVEMLKACRIAQTEKKDKSEAKEKAISGSDTPTSSTPREGRSSARTSSESTLPPRTASPVQSDDVSRISGSDANSLGTTITPNHRQTLSSISGHDLRKGSASSSPSRKASGGPNQMSFESMIDSGKGVSRIVSAGIKSPMDFTMALAKGFHNAPKLYGDDTVRPAERITGIQSGFKAVGKEFHYGFYDGITGLVTQPLKGAEKEGAAGFFKGAAKGIGGLILKPAAGIWGIPGYAAKGIYAELQKHFGSSVQNYIIAARTAQGYEEWKDSTPEQRMTIINAWKSRQDELRRRNQGPSNEAEGQNEGQQKQRSGSGDWLSSFKQTRHLPYDERKKLAAEKQRRKEEKKRRICGGKARAGKSKSRCKYCPLQHDEGVSCPFKPAADSPSNHSNDDEFEEAIKKSVTTTSKGNPEEDAMIERALRASVNELKNARSRGSNYEGYDRAVAAGAAEASGGLAGDAGANHDDDDAELSEALQRSLREHGHEQLSKHDERQDTWDSGFGSEDDEDDNDDEDYRRAVEGSKRATWSSTSSGPPPQYTELGGLPEVKDAKSAATAVAAGSHDKDEGEDAELQRAMSESKQAHQSKEDELGRQRTEEEIVMEYVKRQSLLEEEHRKRMVGDQG
jgi:UDP:flavonoid glycosyltransferase YjiC (YdhE family)